MPTLILSWTISAPKMTLLADVLCCTMQTNSPLSVCVFLTWLGSRIGEILGLVFLQIHLEKLPPMNQSQPNRVFMDQPTSLEETEAVVTACLVANKQPL